MDSAKKIRKFINPSFVPIIIWLLIIGFGTIIGLILLFGVALPAMKRAKKCVEKLEAAGKLDQAAAEMTSPNAKYYMKGNLILTPNFIFCKRIFTNYFSYCLESIAIHNIFPIMYKLIISPPTRSK